MPSKEIKLTAAQKKCRVALNSYMNLLQLGDQDIVAQVHYIPGFLPPLPENDPGNVHNYLRVCTVLAASGRTAFTPDYSKGLILIRPPHIAKLVAAVANHSAVSHVNPHSLVAFIAKIKLRHRSDLNLTLKDLIDKVPGSHGIGLVATLGVGRDIMQIREALAIMEITPEELDALPLSD